MRVSGTLKFYNSAKGFGFITPEDGSKDVFVHATALELAGIQSLNEGDKVSFDENFSLTFKSAVVSDVPEPVTLSLFGAGVAGAAFARRRKAKA